jgi:hypothetical protein
MRYLTLNINDHTSITIDNDITGKESVFYNGELMSSHRSFFGSKHEFSVEELGNEVRYKVDISLNGFTGIGFEIKRNDSIVMSNKARCSSTAEQKSWKIILTITMLFFAGGLVGWGIKKEDYAIVFAGIFLVAGSLFYNYIKSYFTKA